MSCEGHRSHYFAQVNEYAPGIAPGDLENIFQSGRNRPAQNRADELKAELKTRLLFADMQDEGIKPPTHSPTGLPKKDAQLGYAAVYDHLQSKGFFSIEGRGKGNGAHAADEADHDHDHHEDAPAAASMSDESSQAALEADADMRQELPQEKIDKQADQSLAGVRLSGGDEEDTRKSARFPVWQYIPRCAKCGRFMATQNPVCQNPKCGMQGKKQQDPIDWPPAGATFKKTPKARPADWEANRALPKARIRIVNSGTEKDVTLERVSADRRQIEYSDGDHTGQVDRADVTQWEGQPAKTRRKKIKPETLQNAPADKNVKKSGEISIETPTEAPTTGNGSDGSSGQSSVDATGAGSQKCPKCGQFMGDDHVCSAALPDDQSTLQTELPKYLVEKDGKIAQVVRWNGDRPVVIYPANDGGTNPRTNSPYEYTIKSRGQWRPATDDDFEARMSKRISGVSRNMVGAWRDDLRHIEAAKPPASVHVPLSAEQTALINPVNTWAKVGQVVRRKDTGEEFVTTGFSRTPRQDGIMASLQFRDGRKSPVNVDLAYLELVEDVDSGIPLYQLPDPVIHPIYGCHVRDWENTILADKVGAPTARPRFRKGYEDEAFVAAARASLYHGKPYYVYFSKDSDLVVSERLGASELGSFFEINGLHIEKYSPNGALRARAAIKSGAGAQNCPNCGQFMGDDHICNPKAVKDYGWEKTQEWALGQDKARGNNHTFMAAFSLLNGKYDDVIKDIERGRLTRDDATQVIDRLWENGAILESDRYYFTQRIEQSITKPPLAAEIPTRREYQAAFRGKNGEFTQRYFADSPDHAAYQAEHWARGVAEMFGDPMEYTGDVAPVETGYESGKKALSQDEFEAMYRQGRIGRSNGQMYGLYAGDDGETVWGPVEIAIPADDGPGAQKCPKCGQFMGEDHVCPVTDEGEKTLGDYIADPDDQPAVEYAGTLGDYIVDPDDVELAEAAIEQAKAQVTDPNAPLDENFTYEQMKRVADGEDPAVVFGDAPRRVVPADEWEQIQRAAMDWKYLTVSAGGMARKSDLDDYLMGQFNLTGGAARSVSNSLDELLDHFAISDGGVIWDAEAAGRPVPQWGDHPELAPPTAGRLEGAKLRQKCQKCGQFMGEDHTCPPSRDETLQKLNALSPQQLSAVMGEVSRLDWDNRQAVMTAIDALYASVESGQPVNLGDDQATYDLVERVLGEMAVERMLDPLPSDQPVISVPTASDEQPPAPPEPTAPEPPPLHPLTDLKLKKRDGWNGNKMEAGELITDGYMMFLADAIKSPAIRDEIARPPKKLDRSPVEQNFAQQVFSESSEAARTPAELYGYVATPDPDDYDRGMIVSADGDVICVDALKMARVSASVDYDRITISKRKKTDPVVFWKDNRAVALMMPLDIPDKPSADELMRQRRVLQGESETASTISPDATAPALEEPPGPGSQKCPKCGQFMGEDHVCPVTDEMPAASAPVTSSDEALAAIEAAPDAAVTSPATPEPADLDDEAPAPTTRKKKPKENYGYKPGEGSAFNYIPKWMDIPGIGETADEENRQAVLKFFTPDGNWTWYVTEYDGNDLCFGLVDGFETEWGYFSLSEISSVKGPMGLKIERDKWFRPQPIKQLKEYRDAFGGDSDEIETVAPEPTEPDSLRTLQDATQAYIAEHPGTTEMDQREFVSIANAYLVENPGASPDDVGNHVLSQMGAQKCPKCGQFMGEDHVCPVTNEAESPAPTSPLAAAAHVNDALFAAQYQAAHPQATAEEIEYAAQNPGAKPNAVDTLLQSVETAEAFLAEHPNASTDEIVQYIMAHNGPQKCPKCGQFMGEDHTCPTLPGIGDGSDDSLESGIVAPPADETPADDPFYVPDESVTVSPRGPDYTITDADQIGKGTAKERAKANLAAIRLVKQLEADGRMATPDEQAILVKFVGWGGLQGVFKRENGWYNPNRVWDKKPEFYDEWKELQELLTTEEYDAAQKSVLNAHYTSPTVVRGVWKALKQMGFDRFKGNVLEPASGIGHFFGLMPDEFKGCGKVGVELDSFTARIAKHLYQNSNIQNSGFEDTNLPDNFFDLAISNVPFGAYGVTDKEFRGPLRFLTRSIHNFFFAKSLRKVKPGGVVAFITSRYTMDSQDPAIREYLAKEADLVGAIRLPNTAFKENAGTEVTTDIIFLRKRGQGEPPSNTAWVNTQPITGGDGTEIRVNDYFATHPDMMLGNLTTRGSMYAKGEVTLEPDKRDLATALDDAIGRLPADALKAPAGHCGTCGAFLAADGQCNNPGCHSKQPLTHVPRMATRKDKENEYVMKDGQLYRVSRGQLLSPDDDAFDEVDEESGKRKKPKRDSKVMQRIQGMVEVNAAARALLALNVNQADNEALQAAQTNLAQVYDAFVAQHGCVSTDPNKRALKNDPNLPFLLALEEDYDSHAKTAKKAAIFNKRTIAVNKVIDHADSPQDALRVTLSEGGVINWERMATLTGRPIEQLQRSLRLQKAVFQSPDGEWQTASEYLSGNVRDKLNKAKAAAAIDPRYQINVDALEEVIPRDLEAGEIKVRLGSSWIPPEDVAAFAAHMLDANFEVDYNPTAAEWSVQPTKKSSNKYWTKAGEFNSKSAKNTEIWAGGRGTGLDLLKKTLNAQQATYYDEVEGPDGKKKVMNQEATIAAREMQAKIAKEFEQWIFSDPARAERLLRKYNDTFNSEVPRDYDGSHLTLPGLGATMPQLRQHQLDNIWRITQGDNTLLAHMVGAGKTFTMIGGGMELRRMGLRKKVMYTVPNHMLEQFAADIYRMYPAANVLALGVDDLTPEKRAETMSRVATGDYDAVVVTHSAFGKIPVSVETQTRYLREQLDELDAALEDLKQNAEDGDKITVKKMEKAKAKLEDKIKNMQETVSSHQDNTINWDDLGVDQLFVDEADLYKNLDFPTRRNISGVKGAASQRAFDMYTKIRSMGDKFGHGKGVCFATGTPIANSVSEMYNMQRYLDHHNLVDQNIAHFDAWANQFGESVTAIEMKPSGGGYQTKERFAQFNNVPELKRMYMRFADIRTDPDELKLPRPQLAADEKGERRQRGMVAPASPELKGYIAELVERADNLKNVSPREDNMLKITGDGRKAALDMRLVDKLAEDDPNSKLNKCVASVLDIYKETTGVEVEGMEGKHNMAQIVFCDLGTPAARERGDFCVYDDIKSKLVARGVKPEEIAFMQDCKNDDEKFELFGKVNSGQVRVLIGSTETMGSGMNAQRRMAALHHLDAPWRPRDIEQREGRILRQGNLNKEIKINRYLTEGSFDVYNWQLLERKQRFISQVMNRSLNERSVEDIDSQALTYAEMKALATGNPAVIEKVAVDTELRRLEALEKAHKSSSHSVRVKVEKLPKDIAASRSVLEGAQKAHTAITQAREGEVQRETQLKAEIEQARTFARETAAKAKEQDTPENRQQAETARKAFDAKSERFKRNGAFRIRLNDREYDEKDQASKALADIETELIMQGGGGDRAVGEYMGFPLIARVPKISGEQCHFFVKFTDQDARPVGFDMQAARTFNANAEGGENITHLRRVLNIPENDIKLHQNQISTWTSELETLQRSGGGEFEHTGRLAQLRQRERELAEIMKAYGDDKQVFEGNDSGGNSE